MKRHQEILQIIFGIIMLGFVCFLLYKFYTIIIQFPIFFSVLGGVLILWLIYNFRITVAKIGLYFNRKTSYNLLKNHLEKGRAVALKKYLFANATYCIYYKAPKNEREKLKEDLEKGEKYLTEALKLMNERDEKIKNNIDREKFEELSKEWEYLFKGRPQQKEIDNVFFMIKTIFTHFFRVIKWSIPIAFKFISIYFHYSFIKYFGAYYYRGAIRTVLEKNELALEDFEECLKYDDDKKISLYGKTCVLYELKRYDKALKVIEEILEIDSKYKDAIYKRGSIYHKQGNTEAACKDWKLAIEYGYTESIDEIEKRRERCTKC